MQSKSELKTLVRQGAVGLVLLAAVQVATMGSWVQDYTGAPIHSAARVEVGVVTALYCLVYLPLVLIYRKAK